MRMHTLVPAVLVLMMVSLAYVPATSQAQTPQDTLIVGVQQDMANMNPFNRITNTIWNAFMWRNWVYESLFALKPDGQYYPLLANDSRIGQTSNQPGWDTDASGLNITVFIRRGITFTDGVSLNADDVIFSFQIQSFNSLISTPLLSSIVWGNLTRNPWPRWNATTTWGAAHPTHVGVTKVDNFTVTFHLAQIYSVFFEGVLTNPIMPMHIWKDHLVAVKLSDFGIKGGTEFDFDTRFGVQPSETQATIGTGPFKLDYWVPQSSTEISTYANYWGKGKSVNFQNRDWPFYPDHVRKMHFNVYGSFDVVVLALKKGEVQVAPWGLSISQWNDLKQNPAMGFRVTTNDGFFYLSFNLRKGPMSDLAFRQAVAYSIDKDFIVNRLLGGFGIKGQLPVGPLNPAYINASATTPGFDLTLAASTLAAAGYVDRDGDGWRDRPDGSPIKLTMLTPAKDYDPVRADAGIMISNNLKSIGLNVDSAPTEFNALVSAITVTVDFDLYIIGNVNFGLFPELYLRNFWGCDFFVETGRGVNRPGYCNTYVDAKLDVLDTSLRSDVRQQAAKDIEGALARDLPFDTLYIRRQIEGYRSDIWTGWTGDSEIFNPFSISVLAPPGQVTPPSGPLKISLEVPGNVRAATNLAGQVFAEQNNLPASGASVNVSTSFGGYQVVTTDSKGYAGFSIPVPFIAGAFSVVASGSLGSSVGGDSATVTAIIPNPFAKLTVWSDTPVVNTGGTATIHAKVTDRSGSPISGATLATIPVLTLGKIVPTTNTTDSTGMANFAYTAPASTLIPNKNQMDTVQISVSMPNTVLPEVSRSTYIMGVVNPVTNWTVVRITNINAGVGGTVPVVDRDPLTLTIPQTVDVTVQVTNQAGTPIGSENVTAIVSNLTRLSVAPANAKSDATGHATFTFTAQTDQSSPVEVSFAVQRAFRSEDSLVILVANQSVPAQAMWVDVGPMFGPSRSSFSVTAHVFNATGAPANATEVDLFAPYSSAGQPPRFTGGGFIALVGSTWSGRTSPTGTASTTASWTTAPSIQGAFPSDSPITVEAGAGGYGPTGAFVLGTTPSKTWTLDTAIMARAPPAVLNQGSLSTVEFSPHDNRAMVRFRFAKLGASASSLAVAIYRGLGDLRCPPTCTATKLGDFTTSSSGWINVTYTEPTSDITIAAGFTAVITDNRYALGGQFGSVPFETIYPYVVDPSALVVTGTTQTKLVSAGQSDTFSLTVKDIFGNPVQGATVAGGPVRGVTGSTGQVDLSIPTNAGINDITFVAYTTDGRSGSVQLGTYGGVAVLGLSGLTISDTTPVRGDTVYVNASLSNTGPVDGTFVVDLKVDGTTVYQKTVTVPAGGAPVTVSFVWVPTDTASHTLTIGTLTGQTVQATPPAVAAAGVETTIAIGLAVGLLVIGLVVGLLMGRRGGGMRPSATMPREEKPEAPAEEELPPEL